MKLFFPQNPMMRKLPEPIFDRGGYGRRRMFVLAAKFGADTILQETCGVVKVRVVKDRALLGGRAVTVARGELLVEAAKPKLIETEGADPFLVNLLFVLRECLPAESTGQ